MDNYPQWEYLVMRAPPTTPGREGKEFLISCLNDLGSLGWELAAAHEGKLIYKRIKDPKWRA